MKNTMTAADREKETEIIMALAKAIQGFGEIPSGHLYAHVLGHLSFQEYEKGIALLVRAGAVKKASSGLLTWVRK